jgi:hypothetical protein
MIYLFCFLFSVLLVGIIFAVVTEKRDSKALSDVARELGFQEIKVNGLPHPTVRAKWNDIQLSLEAEPAPYRSSKRGRIIFAIEILSPAYLLIQNHPRKWEAYPNQTLNPITKNNNDCLIESENPLLAWGILNDNNCKLLLAQNLQSPDDEFRIFHNRMIVKRRINFAGFLYQNISELKTFVWEEWDLIQAAIEVTKRVTTRANALKDPDTICPFCRVALEDTTPLIICSVCGSWHHDSCWREHGRCSIFGCSGSAIIGLSRT